MRRIRTADGVQVSFDRWGAGPPLVLVHGAFSDHRTNWQEVQPLLAPRFTGVAVARRGRGETDATRDHGLVDEARDVAAVVEAVGEPVFLLGHSYGAQAALAAAALAPARVRRLVLYEPPMTGLIGDALLSRLEALGARGDWDELVETFLRDGLRVPPAEIAELRASRFWKTWIDDAAASLCDLRAIARYAFDPARFRGLAVPVVLLVGSESPRELYATDALAAVLSDVRIVTLDGQAHEGMTTAPAQFAEVVTRLLL